MSKRISMSIIVVDNCSPDSSYNILKKEIGKDVTLLCAQENAGFSAGNNIGIKYALREGAEYIMLINNDTEADENMAYELLLRCNSKTVVSPKIFYYDKPDTIWFAGGRYSKKTGRFTHIGENQKDGIKFNHEFECDFLTGCCFMISSETIKEVGELPEEYFMYYEDVAYSLRLKRNKIKLLFVPKAHLWHKVGATSGIRSKFSLYYANRNRIYLLRKFNFNYYIRFMAILSRLLIALKGTILWTNERIIWLSIKDSLKGKMGR